ncbi:tyrosine decarboxylase-like [Daphnia pulicaria]|uniref:tyrosine decarboxylase-like n=1 Tax=Daphnia pulicaria TaxID=35523 RepID=UPI001EEBDD18|nr:tyrosine decarboxylase-like [Daphnia pulicaria]XP_046631352.1 tyrosine decarboxylase-like [Daphnia pulicaria]XP_046631353.1 tyrosine decarboxylase-like [Daphnia pulicaria]XP_046631354.1 tyrosine decarboxylase-like [Daphnia pulicaria]XP_046631355.1 tyrosine decarboxylase-like [Daphnia pulicaria]XP_046631356.1 tyrosine decarboxylase-like [Daphnia pulicaria]
MDSAEFRQRGREMVDYIVEYMETLGERRVTPSVEPGYLREIIPKNAPEEGEKWEEIMSDVESKIMPGVAHWQHPRFHAYFPSGNSFPSILGDMLSDGIGAIGFSWAASPACTELETIVLDWLGQMIGLPDEFLSFSDNSKGGGVMQSSASECVLVSLLAARAQKIKELKTLHPFVEEGVLLSKLVAYCSKEAHSCVEKAAMIAFTKLRILDPDENLSLRGTTLAQAIEEDRALGLIPFFVSATLGTTSCVSFDNLAEIGPIAQEAGTWLHVDAAYAGNAFICPEFKYLMDGIEFAMSFNTNPNKWLLTNFDCSTMWVRDRFKLTQAMVVDPLYLQHSHSGKAIDYRHWGIPLSRRFRALKLWFVIRNYGVAGLQNYIREHCRLAKCFESLVKDDERFEVCNTVKMGLVCFRVKGDNELNQKLLLNINASGKLHMVPASIHGRFIIRFCVCAQDAKDSDIEYAWNVITDFATELLNEEVNLSKSVVSLDGLESCDEELVQHIDQLEISELMDLMETVQFPIQKPHRKHGSWLKLLGTRVRKIVKNGDSH